MYRMMYDCDEHEDWCTKKFPYDEDGFVKKDDFIKYCDWHRHIIQPGTIHASDVTFHSQHISLTHTSHIFIILLLLLLPLFTYSAMGYQRKVRKRTGGVIMWAGLTSYRKKAFIVHDTESETLELACKSIVDWVSHAVLLSISLSFCSKPQPKI